MIPKVDLHNYDKHVHSYVATYVHIATTSIIKMLNNLSYIFTHNYYSTLVVVWLLLWLSNTNYE